MQTRGDPIGHGAMMDSDMTFHFRDKIIDIERIALHEALRRRARTRTSGSWRQQKAGSGNSLMEFADEVIRHVPSRTIDISHRHDIPPNTNRVVTIPA